MRSTHEDNPGSGEFLNDGTEFRGKVVDWLLGRDDALENEIEAMEARRPNILASEDEINKYNLDLAKLLGRRMFLDEAMEALSSSSGLAGLTQGEGTTPTLPFPEVSQQSEPDNNT